MHGSDRGPMGHSQTAVPTEAAARRSRSALEGRPCGFERGIMDIAHGSSLARPATSLSALSNLPPSFPAVAARRTADRGVDSIGRRPARPGQTGLVGDVHRRQLQFGEKRGAAVGPTRRGKGSKSWRSSTAMVFLSPSASPALRRMKQNSSKPRSSSASCPRSRSE